MRTITLFCCLAGTLLSTVSCSKPAEPTVALTASQPAIDAGGSVTLAWGSENASSVRIEPGIGDVGETGNRPVSPTSSITYTATAIGPGGTAASSVKVTVSTPSISDLFESTMETVYFDFDRADIPSAQVGSLQTATRFLEEHADVRFSIEGHADERGSQKYNVGIGERRANAVRTFLMDRGIEAARIDITSFGEDRPVCTQSNENCWSRNRRVEYTLRRPGEGELALR